MSQKCPSGDGDTTVELHPVMSRRSPLPIAQATKDRGVRSIRHGVMTMTAIITPRKASDCLVGNHASSKRRNHSIHVWIAEGIRLDGLLVR